VTPSAVDGPTAVAARADLPVVVPLEALSYPEEIVLPWGDAEGEIGLIPPAEERIATGPSSLAVGPDGTLWVLDAVNARLVHLSRRGDWLESIPSPSEADDLAVGPDGRLYVLSLMNRQVAVIQPNGPTETVSFSMALRLIAGIQLDERGHVLLQNAYQETFDLGRPGAWVGWPGLLHTKIEGIPGVSGGPRLQAALIDGSAALVTPSRGQGVGDTWPLPETEGVASVRLLDSEPDGGAVVLLEWFRDDRVARSVRWLDPQGRPVTEQELPSAPMTFPFRELAVGPSGFLHQLYPQPDGLHIRSYPAGREP
jgi:hypothetical protein